MISFKKFIYEDNDSKFEQIKELEKELINLENEKEIAKIKEQINFLKDELSKSKPKGDNDEEI